jgi:PAS domain S-box-containing protein
MSSQSAWETIRPYVFALACCVSALGISIPVYPYIQHSPRIFLFIAVVASSRYGGLWPGVTSATLTTLMGLWLVAAHDSAHTWFSPVAYLLVSLVAVGVVAQLRNRTIVLREKEQQLTDFMENATVGIHWLAEDGTVLWANSATCRLLECNSEKCCMGRKFQDYCVNPADGTALLKRLAGRERLKNFEIVLRARDGSPRVVLVDADVLWKAGKFVHARCFLRDITARKRAEQAMQENAAKFRAVFDQSIDSIVVFKDGRLLMANPACLALFGYDTMEALASRDVLEMIAASHRDQVREYFERRNRGETAPFHYQTRGVRQGGVEFDMEVTASAFVLHDEPHTLGILRDVTRRVRAEDALAEERNLLRTLIDALPDCIYTKDRESRLLISNAANVRLFGAQSEADVRGKSLSELCPGDFTRAFENDDRRVVGEGRPLVDREEPFLRFDGEERTFLTTKLPLRNAANEIVGLVGISRDITESKLAGEALRKSEAGLKLAQRIGCIGSWEADLERNTLSWSEETYRIFGCKPESFKPFPIKR